MEVLRRIPLSLRLEQLPSDDTGTRVVRVSIQLTQRQLLNAMPKPIIHFSGSSVTAHPWFVLTRFSKQTY